MDTPRKPVRKLATLCLTMARQQMGQHFLVDLSWRKRILESLPPRATETWVEIGAGHGEMTQLLAAPEGRVIAIEVDARLTADLRSRLRREPAKWPGVEIVAGDVLKLNLTQLARGRFRVYGNLPYYITSPILHHLFAFAEQIVSIHVVVQWEVARRIVAPPGRRDYGYLSAACQFYTRPEIVLRIPPGAFRPSPQVSSALVRMILPGARASLGITDECRFLKFVQMCFGQKRKTLRNNLRGTFSDDLIQDELATSGLSADARAEQLSLTQFARLFGDLTATAPLGA
jgi:16S rRNA (adenine1518-N6/adenine1519-N6)-dimethyltransferase